jgi:hypothetical protein
MSNWLFMPPVLFVIVFIAIWALAKLLSGLAFKGAKRTAGGGEAYACGEDNYNHLAQPDYSSFFPFAFFFTLAHVATLIMTTVPTGTFGPFVLAAIYVSGVAVGLYILFRR